MRNDDIIRLDLSMGVTKNGFSEFRAKCDSRRDILLIFTRTIYSKLSLSEIVRNNINSVG